MRSLMVMVSESNQNKVRKPVNEREEERRDDKKNEKNSANNLSHAPSFCLPSLLTPLSPLSSLPSCTNCCIANLHCVGFQFLKNGCIGMTRHVMRECCDSGSPVNRRSLQTKKKILTKEEGRDGRREGGGRETEIESKSRRKKRERASFLLSVSAHLH